MDFLQEKTLIFKKFNFKKKIFKIKKNNFEKKKIFKFFLKLFGFLKKKISCFSILSRIYGHFL